MSTLSPQILSALRRHTAPGYEPEADLTNRRQRVKTRVVYACPDCGEWHEDEDDAAECCADDLPSATQNHANACPVCQERADDAFEAADCCLWKSIGHWDRYRIAQAVERGATWPEAVEAVTGEKVAA